MQPLRCFNGSDKGRYGLARTFHNDGSAELVASHTRLFKGVGDDHELGSRAVVLQGQHHKQTRPRLDYQNQAAGGDVIDVAAAPARR